MFLRLNSRGVVLSGALFGLLSTDVAVVVLHDALDRCRRSVGLAITFVRRLGCHALCSDASDVAHSAAGATRDLLEAFVDVLHP